MKQRLHVTLHLFLVVLVVLGSICPFSRPVLGAARKSPVFIVLTKYSKTLDIGNEFTLGAIVSNGARPAWKSSNSKVASVNTYGLVTARKNGKAKITAKVSGAEASCTVTVNKTKLTLNTAALILERGETARLKADTSNGSQVQFKSKKPSVATVSEDGKVCGEKPGSTYITVTADNTKVNCRVTVKKPSITLSHTSYTLSPGTELVLRAKVSSGFTPQWKSNKSRVATVDDDGRVYALKAGTARISAKVDGVVRYCTIKVTE